MKITPNNPIGIHISKLTDKDVGRWVIYLPKNEIGRIKSWNETFIFVVYHCDGNWSNYQIYTVSTNPRDLEFI